MQRGKNERSVAFKIRQISFSLGELTTLSRPPSRLGKGHPSPYLAPLGTDPLSALAMRTLQKSSQIYAYTNDKRLGNINSLPLCLRLASCLFNWFSAMVWRLSSPHRYRAVTLPVCQLPGHAIVIRPSLQFFILSTDMTAQSSILSQFQ